jgi:hypothetical protein
MQLSVMVPPSYYFKFLLEIGAAVQSDETTCTSSGTAGGGGTPPTTQVNVGASRALDGTVYQNIGSTPMWVSVSGRCATGGNGDFYAMTNSTNSLVNPTNITAIQADIGLGNWGSLTFVVLPSWYYSVTQEACTPDATRFWTEWQ